MTAEQSNSIIYVVNQYQPQKKREVKGLESEETKQRERERAVGLFSTK